MGRLFGTDGVRGLANADLTPALALELATSAARCIVERNPRARSAGRRPFAVLGRDPRASGEMLEAAVAAGLAAAGVDVLLVGVLPTPGVAFLTADQSADLGVVISASHNPMPDNGIKIFAAGGHKLPDEVEDDIERDIRARAAGTAGMVDRTPPTGAAVGRIRRSVELVERYTAHLLVCTPNPLTGLRVVVDCAHGAASAVAPAVYRAAGAEVIVLAGDPDGLNINDGVGSTHLDGLRAAVLEHGADAGIAHDGDADRCLAIAADGSDVDGDAILAVLALAMRDRGELAESTVVATVMSNLGFHHAMRDAGLRVATTAVGDRYVLEEMRGRGYTLGGEQSGHVVLIDHATTGDGILTALMLLARMAAAGRPLAELAGIVRRLPQVLINVRVSDKDAVAGSPAVADAVAEATAELADTGRLLLRPSGTEPLVRVMVEAGTAEQARTVADRVAKVVASV